MKTKAFLIFSISFLIISTCVGQTSVKDLIQGTWILVKQETTGGLAELDINILDLIPLNDNTEEITTEPDTIPDIVLKFGPNKELKYIQWGDYFQTRYKINKKEIILGDTSYELSELSESGLIMKKITGFGVTTFYYIRSENDISHYMK